MMDELHCSATCERTNEFIAWALWQPAALQCRDQISVPPPPPRSCFCAQVREFHTQPCQPMVLHTRERNGSQELICRGTNPTQKGGERTGR